jgi:hypothetical protein
MTDLYIAVALIGGRDQAGTTLRNKMSSARPLLQVMKFLSNRCRVEEYLKNAI